MAAAAARAADEKKATDVLILDLRGLTVMADYFVIASADTEVQTRAISNAVTEALQAYDRTWHRREGWDDARWVLLDYGDVVVHIFREETRDYFDLERLWGDAPRLSPDEVERLERSDEKRCRAVDGNAAKSAMERVTGVEQESLGIDG